MTSNVSASGRIWNAARRVLRASRTVAAASALTLAVLMPAMTTSVAQAAVTANDELVFKDGRTVVGNLISQDDNSVVFEIVVGSLKQKMTYSRAEILAVVEGEDVAADAPAASNGSSTTPTTPEPSEDAPSVYVLNLTGWVGPNRMTGWEQFADRGGDITPTSVRRALDDAKKHRPDYLVIVIDNTLAAFGEDEPPEDLFTPGSIYEAEELEPIFTREIPQDWGYEPEIVIWIKNAMGGISMLPFNFENIYFHPDGRMGGMGFVISQMYGAAQDAIVAEKWISATMGRVEGMAIRGGYDVRIVQAMALRRNVLSYRINNGEVELLEREPQSPDEFLLTDNGFLRENVDGNAARVRGTGNDVLTLRAEVAETLRISDGTVSSIDELIAELGISRNYRLIDGRGDAILERWSRDVDRAYDRLEQLGRDFADVRARGNEPRDVRAAISRRINILQDVISTVNRFDGAVIPQFARWPSEPNLQIQIEQMRQELMKLR
ncbi:MAG: hypothetical protein AAF747_04240 [Planctomycetota bacterium]